MSRVLSVWRPKSAAFLLIQGQKWARRRGRSGGNLFRLNKFNFFGSCGFNRNFVLWSVVRDGNGGFLASGAVVDFDPILVEPEFNFVVAVLGFGGSFRMLISTFCHGSNCQ